MQPNNVTVMVAFSALTLLVGRQEGDPACKKYGEDVGGEHWLVRTQVAPSRMVGVTSGIKTRCWWWWCVTSVDD